MNNLVLLVVIVVCILFFILMTMNTKEHFGVTDFVNPVSWTKCGGTKLWKSTKTTFFKIGDLIKSIWDIIKSIVELVITIVSTPVQFVICLWKK